MAGNGACCVLPFPAAKVVFVIARTIRVNTEDLWDAAKRFERLAADSEDVAAELGAVRANLTGAYSRDEYLERADDLTRKARGIAYNLREMGGKLVFAASRYEDYDRHIRQTAKPNDIPD